MACASSCDFDRYGVLRSRTGPGQRADARRVGDRGAWNQPLALVFEEGRGRAYRTGPRRPPTGGRVSRWTRSWSRSASPLTYGRPPREPEASCILLGGVADQRRVVIDGGPCVAHPGDQRGFQRTLLTCLRIVWF